MMKNNLIDLIFEICNLLNIPAVIIGGLALPAYNVARTTLDIDISIYIRTQEELDQFIKKLNEHGIETKQVPKKHHDLFTIFGKSSEAEIWLKPCDAFEWDDEMISKRKKFYKKIYVLSVEDFILTKFLRMDRSAIDIQDIIQIIINNHESINWDYLIYRLKNNHSLLQFNSIIETILKEYPVKIPEKIIQEFKN